MHLDLVDLRLFLHVAEAQNITHGAARTNMALASASERIHGMEQSLGVALLQRQRRGVSLTPAGRAVAHHAQLVMQQIDQMQAELSVYSGEIKGHVRILANSSALSEFLPEALNAFLAANPGIDVDVEERPSYDIIRAVAEGFAEIGIVADIVDFAGLQAFPFATDRLVLITPQRHPFAGRRVAFRDLLDQDFVGMASNNALQQHLGQHAIQAGHPLKLRVRLGSFDAIARMVENGVGIAVIPETAARRCRKTMAFRIGRLIDPWSRRHLHVCIRNAADLPTPAQRLLDHLAHHNRNE
ncbi:MAG TPA: LysR family transcriptional regulator [Acetobacteraceae bacterium]|jgi:DNA-binding transcriptional LysR family regulator